MKENKPVKTPIFDLLSFEELYDINKDAALKRLSELDKNQLKNLLREQKYSKGWGVVAARFIISLDLDIEQRIEIYRNKMADLCSDDKQPNLWAMARDLCGHMLKIVSRNLSVVLFDEQPLKIREALAEEFTKRLNIYLLKKQCLCYKERNEKEEESVAKYFILALVANKYIATEEILRIAPPYVFEGFRSGCLPNLVERKKTPLDLAIKMASEDIEKNPHTLCDDALKKRLLLENRETVLKIYKERKGLNVKSQWCRIHAFFAHKDFALKELLEFFENLPNEKYEMERFVAATELARRPDMPVRTIFRLIEKEPEENKSVISLLSRIAKDELAKKITHLLRASEIDPEETMRSSDYRKKLKQAANKCPVRHLRRICLRELQLKREIPRRKKFLWEILANKIDDEEAKELMGAIKDSGIKIGVLYPKLEREMIKIK